MPRIYLILLSASIHRISTVCNFLSSPAVYTNMGNLGNYPWIQAWAWSSSHCYHLFYLSLSTLPPSVLLSGKKEALKRSECSYNFMDVKVGLQFVEYSHLKMRHITVLCSSAPIHTIYMTEDFFSSLAAPCHYILLLLFWNTSCASTFIVGSLRRYSPPSRR